MTPRDDQIEDIREALKGLSRAVEALARADAEELTEKGAAQLSAAEVVAMQRTAKALAARVMELEEFERDSEEYYEFRRRIAIALNTGMDRDEMDNAARRLFKLKEAVNGALGLPAWLTKNSPTLDKIAELTRERDEYQAGATAKLEEVRRRWLAAAEDARDRPEEQASPELLIRRFCDDLREALPEKTDEPR